MQDIMRTATATEADREENDSLLPIIEPTREERWGAPCSAVVAYIYVVSIYAGEHWLKWLAGFGALFCAGAAWTLRKTPRARESWLWLACLWVTLICGAIGRANAWGDWCGLIAHGFAVYWVAVRSGALLGGGTSRYFPVDVLHGAIVVPLRNLLLRLSVLRICLRRRGKGSFSPVALLGTALAALAALTLFVFSALLLSSADPNFERLTGGLWRALEGMDGHYVIYLIFSLPVGAYLFGLVFGLKRESGMQLEARRRDIDAGLRDLRRVPGMVWPGLLGAFAALYLVFFAVQGSYLFDGLRNVLPERFTAAEYARRGFFELCGVLAVNFTLLGLAALSIEGGLRSHPAAKNLSAALLLESALLAVTAGAKLILYIRRFGFTPLRLQSAWLVLTLLAGCLAALRSLLTGRDATRAWLAFSAVALAGTMVW